MTALLTVAQGTFALARLPLRPRELLQAWDAADEYLLDYLAANPTLSASKPRILILNDSFGALAVALSHYQPHALSDSYLSHQATRRNLQANQLSEHSVTLLTSLEAPEGVFDWVVIKAPKTLALLEHQLLGLRPHLTASTQIIVAGMIKNLSASVWKLLEKLVGSTTTSLAKKKARLIFAQPNFALTMPPNPYPVCYQLEGTDYLISNHANVFSRDSLDIGTRFFLQHLPVKPNVSDIIDLGCGNGLLGLIVAERNPSAKIHFVDESFMALASAQDNFYRAFADSRTAVFCIGNGLADFAPESADLIVCNPPFHQQHAIGDQIADTLFKQSLRVLRNNSELWVVGNRHLNYHLSLKRLFGNCKTVAMNAKFVILSTKKTS